MRHWLKGSIIASNEGPRVPGPPALVGLRRSFVTTTPVAIAVVWSLALTQSAAQAPALARLEYRRSHLRYYRKHNGVVLTALLRAYQAVTR